MIPVFRGTELPGIADYGLFLDIGAAVRHIAQAWFDDFDFIATAGLKAKQHTGSQKYRASHHKWDAFFVSGRRLNYRDIYSAGTFLPLFYLEAHPVTFIK